MVSAHRAPSVAGSNMGVPLRIISKTTGSVDSESRGRRRWGLGTVERRPGHRPELESLRCPMLLHRPSRKSLGHYSSAVPPQKKQQLLSITKWTAKTGSDNYRAPITHLATAKAIHLKIGRAHVCTPVTNAHLVCRLLLAQK